MYPIKFIQKDICKDGSDHLFTYIYKFYSSDTKLHYIIRAEYHTEDVFAVKFYCQRDSKSDFKYNKIVNKGSAIKIIITCIQLIPELLVKHPKASFALYASRSIDFSSSSKLTEGLEENQRYRIYKYFIQTRIGSKVFTQFDYPSISSYILINNTNENINQKESDILEMFSRTYDSLPDFS